MSDIEDIYELSPTQEGMLFHSLYAPESGVYVIQFACALRGRLDANALRRAWQRVADRHTVLRTSFHWEEVGKPLQVVRPRVELPWREEDWRGLDGAEQRGRIEAYLRADRHRGFNLAEAPLMRLALFRLTGDAYQFIWSHHHLLLDGWSLSLILKEVFTFYASFCQGRDISLGRSRPYGDYIEWLQGRDWSKAEAFWREALEGFKAPTPLAVDRIPGAGEGYGEQRVQLPVATVDALKSLAGRHRLTLNTLVGGAWALLLSRYSGEEDVVFGAVVSGRPPELAGSESITGLFINTLPVRARAASRDMLVPWLKEFQERQVELRQYEATPLTRVQGWSEVPPGTPLFESIFVFENYPVSVSLEEAGGVEVCDARSIEQSHYPLMLTALPRSGLALQVTYDRARFDDASVARMLGHLETLLGGFVAAPDRRLSDLPLLTGDERRQLLAEWNDTAASYPEDKTIPQLFEEQVERTPDGVALIFGGRPLTYGELNRRADRLARRLRELGAGPETVVGVCIERSPEMVAGLLAVLKAGGAYLPLDPAYPKERLAFMLEDARASVLLTTARLKDALPEHGARVLCVDRDRDEIARSGEGNLAATATPDTAAYVIYTSGSTGRPKGVVGPHRGAVNRFNWMWDEYPFGDDEVCCQKTALSFVDSVWEIFGPLLRGVPLEIIPDEAVKDTARLVEVLAAGRVTRIVLVPSLLRALLDALQDLNATLPRLKYWVTSGETLPVELYERFQEVVPGGVLLNLYGSSEVAADCTWHDFGGEAAVRSAPIGRPIDNCRVYVLDRHLQPVPAGVSGELYVGGDCLARGYFDRPGLTAERFIPDPFSPRPGGRLFRTGDLGYYRPGGVIEYLGRADHQVKIRGFRVEPGEVEGALAGHPSVREAVVTAGEDATGGKRLAAYVVAADAGRPPDATALREYLRGKLPEFMVPSAFVFLDELPLTPSKKVNRLALPPPDASAFGPGQASEQPRTPVEEVLAGVFAEVLRLERVGVHDNFFDLGGHSLLATQAVSRVRSAFNIDLPLRALFNSPTPGSLAQAVSRTLRLGEDQIPSIPPAEKDSALPLSFAQQRLWFLDQLEPGSPAYNLSAAVRISGRLDPEALRLSFDGIVRRHDSLRTSFPCVEGEPRQLVVDSAPLDIPFVDLRGLPERARQAEVTRLAEEEARRGFDLRQAPLVRVVLVGLTEDEHALILTMHHIISDGWSTGVMLRELAALYEASTSGEPAPLPRLEIQYADYAVWQRGWLRGETLARQLEYWSRQLAGELPVLNLPTDRPRPAVQSDQGASHSLTVDKEVADELKRLGRAEGATLFMALLGAFSVLLSRYSQQTDILVGTPVANRSRPETENLIGFFVNTLVLRTDLSGDPTFRELLGRVREAALGAYAHQDLPFERLVDELQPERDLSRNPVFQVMLALQNAPVPELEFAGLKLTPLETESRTAMFDLTLALREEGGRLVGALEYSTALFDPQTVGRMVSHFQVLLRSIIADPDRPVSRLPLLPEEERGRLLAEWSQTRAGVPVDRCLHQLVEARAEREPEAVALVFEGAQVTYGELNRRANRLAHYLKGLGAGPGEIVGVAVNRSVEMVVGLLGILKAGAAYLPLDLSYPAARLALMLADARPRLILAERGAAERLPDYQGRVVLLDESRGEVARQPDSTPAVGVTANCLAYVLYTSGSTGEPKGVMVPHRAVCNHMLWMQRQFTLGGADRVLQHCSLSFDPSVVEIFHTLMAGARLILARPEHHQDSSYLVGLIREQGVTCLEIVPSLLQPLLHDEGFGRCKSLRRVVCGGEVLTAELEERFFERTGAELHNLYGPTEAAITSTFWTCRGKSDRHAVPIGRPIANVSVFILDRHLEPVPAGVAGEMYVGGAGLAWGYLNRPGLTAERFIPDPFSPEPGARLYRTGDLGRRLPDGDILFVGRGDQQVKVRGHRIEPGEVEAVLGRHPAVAQSVAIARDDGRGGKRLVAYVVSDGNQPPAVGELRRFVKERLPDFMVPSAFVFLDALPVTRGGKVDRGRLPAPERARPGLEQDFTAPRNPVEQLLADIWADLLGLERVGVHDNFFELGGDSILSIRVIARAGKAGLRLTAKQLFQHQTVAELAAAAGAVESAEAEQGLVTGPVPLTPVQHWFFEQDLADPHHFNQAVMLKAKHALDAGVLERAVGRLVEHHDALRLRFERGADGWRQAGAGRETNQLFSRVDLSHLPEAEQRRALGAAAAQSQAGLNLTEGPLARVTLFELGEGRPASLLIVIHHLAVDGVSWRILLEDLETVYQQLTGGREAELPPKTTSFKEWSERLSSYAATEAVRGEAAYWAEGPPEQSPLPVDFHEGANTAASARTVSVSLDAEETRALLHGVPPVYHTQINDVLLTALARACRDWVGGRGLLVELEGHGREPIFGELDVSRTVGWFTSAYPVWLELCGEPDPGRDLKSVKERLRGVPGRGIGYGLLRYLSGDEEIMGRLRSLPPPQLSFNYLGQLDEALSGSALFAVADESGGRTRSSRQVRSHLLEVEAKVIGGRLQVDWAYSENLHRRETIEGVAGGFVGALRSIIAHCLSPGAGGYTPSDFPLAGLGQAQLDRLLAGDRNVEDVYTLSPAQQGMLFHSLLDPGSGVYCTQLTCRLEGRVEVAAFDSAWQQVLDRHTALRTSFAWEGLDEPVQIVRRRAKLELDQQDWRAFSSDERRRRFDAYLEADRRRGFELSEAPLMRLALIRTGEGAYEFLWSAHHLLTDGWSMSLLLKEVFSFYEAGRRGGQLRLAPARPYREYIAWLKGQDLSEAESFWRRELAGFEAPTPLGAGRAAGAEGDSPASYAEHEARLSEAETAALAAFARRHKLTLNTLAQGAWALLLGRYGGSDDVTLGTVLSGRPPELPGVETMVGLFINTLPARVKLSPEARLADWLEELQRRQTELRQYEYSPLTRVQEWSEVPPGTPLFESIFVFENYPVDGSLSGRIAGLEVSDVRSVDRTNYPLTVIAMPGEALTLKFIYDRRRFEPAAIARLSDHLKTLFGGFVARPGERIPRLPLLTEAERRQTLVEWNDTEAAYRHPPCVHQMFEAQVEKTPDAPAVFFEGRQLSYRELNARANRLAHYLRKLGAKPDATVGICLGRGVETVTAVLGVLKAGAAYLPLDPEYPRQRLAFMVEDARPEVLLTVAESAGGLPGGAARTVCLDSDWHRVEGESAENPPGGSTAENLCYVIYTSGSTGRPKGVAMRHSAAANLISWQAENSRPGERARTLQFASLSFDVSFQEMFSTWCSGGELVLVSEETRRDAAELLRTLKDEGVERLFLPSVALQQMADVAEGFDLVPGNLREVITAGEQLQVTSHVLRLFERLGRARLHNHYGPTESHVATAFTLPGSPEGWPTLPPVGRPIANTRIYLLDRRLEPVPVGVTGELYVSGACLARGYLNRPGLTAERFVPDPFGGRPGARMYRTGDLARYLEDGNIEFVGRVDQQVKVRGFRVELGEVEAALTSHPGVRQAAVVARESASGHRHLVAYLLADGQTSEGELRGYLKERLPEYMIPSAMVRLDELPLTASGKVDRRGLPEPERWAEGRLRERGAPRTPVGQMVADIFSEVLGVERVGAHDNFFDLGGHSLLATRVVSRLREVTGMELPLRSLFEAPTAAGLAAQIEARLEAGAGVPQAPPLRPAPRGGALPLSFAQQRLWFIDQLDPGNPVYNIPVAVRLRGALDADALERGLNEVVRRHEALRTTFSAVEGVPAQIISAPAAMPISRKDLSGLPETEREAEALRLATEEARRPFDLAEGPLVRASLLRLGAEEHVLLLTMHHIASDGWSMGVLVGELAALYEAFRRGEPSPLEDLPVQYADYAVWQREYLSGEVLERQLAYWRGRLAGAPPALELPTDRPRPQLATYHGAAERFELSAELSESLKGLGRREGVTLFMTLLAAFYALLYRYTGQKEIVVGSPVAGRTRAETEGLIGFFVNTLALRMDLRGDPRFVELLRRVREVCLEAYGHQEVPFEKLVAELQPERDMSRHPFFQVMFVLQNVPLEPLELPGLTLIPLGGDADGAKFDLNLNMEETGPTITGRLLFNTDLFEAATIKRMAGHFRNLLEGLAADPERRLSALPLLSEAEEHQLLVEWNETRGGRPARAECMHEMFEAQVVKTPDAPALVFEEESLSYRELNSRANQLARHLRGRGVGPEVVVGICLENSAEMVVAALGIMKAGGAYLGLDPSSPAERLAFMLKDARVPVILTSTKLAAVLPEHDAEVICLDRDRGDIARHSAEDVRGGARPENLAYVIYTSGSTGRPKGVAGEHRQVFSYLSGILEPLRVVPGASFAMQQALAVDAPVTYLFASLCTGGALHVISRERASDPDALGEYFLRHRIDYFKVAPSYFAAMLDSTRPGRVMPRRLLMIGGEASRREWVEKLRSLAPGCVLLNHYGPTETTVGVLTHEVSAETDGLQTPFVPLGRPLAGSEVYLLDAHLNPVPVGVPGELHVGGANVTRGYLNRPGLTAEKFIPHPFGREPGLRLYKTGDVARRLPDGRIEFLGRIDHQVKVRGFRVELEEIEAVLCEHPAMVAAAVLAKEAAPGDSRLVAYVASERGRPLAAGELRDFLQEKLPEYMVPAVFMLLDSLPRTTQGKIDRRALPPPESLRPEPGEGYVAPRTPAEEKVAQTWARLLGVERVGAHDNFFELGGHSLLATQVVSRLRQVFEVELPLRSLFERPTVAEISEEIDKLKRDGAATAAPAIVPVSRAAHRVRRSELRKVSQHEV